MFSDIGYLLTDTESANGIGDPVTTPVERLVYGDKKSVRQSEFYQGQAQGMRPEIMFEMRLSSYSQESRFKFEGVTYDIIRTFKKNRDFIELICQGVVNNGVI